MKKSLLIILCVALAGFYVFQKDKQPAQVEVEEDAPVTKKINRKIASIPTLEQAQAPLSQDGPIDNEVVYEDDDSTNCQNFDGDEVCYSGAQASDIAAQEIDGASPLEEPALVQELNDASMEPEVELHEGIASSEI
jgi:hypothetical protein